MFHSFHFFSTFLSFFLSYYHSSFTSLSLNPSLRPSDHLSHKQPAFSTSGGLQSEGGFKYHPIHEYPPSMTSAIASPTFSPHPHPPFLISELHCI